MKWISAARAGAWLVAGHLCLPAVADVAYDANLAAGWNPPGSHGQVNGGFVVNTGNFSGNATGFELGLRVQQRGVGPLHNGTWIYSVPAGPDTTTPDATRAWWNFDWSAGFGNRIGDLDGLILGIFAENRPMFATPFGTDTVFTPGVQNLLAQIDILALAGSAVTGSNGVLQDSWNPTFPTVGVPGYSLTDDHFTYSFVLEAHLGGQYARSVMCVQSPGAPCFIDPIPEPDSASIVGVALAALAWVRSRRSGRDIPVASVS